MKRIWIAIALMVVITITSISGLLISSGYTDSIIDSLTQAENAALSGDIEKAASIVDDITQKWEHCGGVLSVYVDHRELEGVTSSLAKLSARIKNKNIDEFSVLCQLCISQMSHIQEIQVPYFKNIL